MGNNKKKELQLGMPIGTASNRLRKLILFDLLVQMNKNICFQCELEIDTADQLSIEHKNPYLDSQDPAKLFFDLNNIGYSHLSCNVSAARPRPVIHPSRAAYQRGCRCVGCTDANAEAKRRWRINKENRNNYRVREESVSTICKFLSNP